MRKIFYDILLSVGNSASDGNSSINSVLNYVLSLILKMFDQILSIFIPYGKLLTN